jgi:hypothetical protein
MTTEEICNELVFEPLVQFRQAGNIIHRCKAKYKGYEILWETYFPWNIFKEPEDLFKVDRIVPMETPIENTIIDDRWYTEEGYGYPTFKTLEHAVEYLNNIEP